jgi:ubiquinone/menaquinone biosynthesis C-methylase UbiE
LKSEGDRWFERNASKIPDARWTFKAMAGFVKPGARVLEIGCSCGASAPFFEGLGVHYTGLDPSSQAIETARRNFPKFEFAVGTADTLPFKDESFDLVFFGFCLYLVDRKLLPRVVAEGDRVLKNKGFLSIIDFDVKYPYRRDYSHAPGVSSYKLDYGSLFLAYPQYSQALKTVFSHEGSSEYVFEERIDERVSLSVLYKDFGTK